MFYREFYVRGVGRELTVDSNRNRPCYLLSAPLAIKKINVKTVELPLTFNPKIWDNRLPFISTYTFSDGTIFTFTDYIDLSGGVVLSAALIESQMDTAFGIHNSDTGANLVADPTVNLVISGTGDDTIQLNATAPNVTLQTSGVYAGRFLIEATEATASGGGITVTEMEVDFIKGSLLAKLMDFPPYVEATITTSDDALGVIFNTLSTAPTIRTRPSYFLLHSNLRTGMVYHSTAVPAETSGTIIAKVTVPQSDSIYLGESAVTWVNPCQDPALFMTTDEADYSKLEFWMTYPDGTTEVDFGGDYFSLTLSTLVGA